MEEGISFDAYAQELNRLRRSVEDEIAQEERRQNSLLAYDERLHSTGIFFLAGILLNLLFLILLPHYMLYWIISSFVLYMVNPFILMIPTHRESMALPDRHAIRGFLRAIRTIGATPYALARQKRNFGKVLWDVFFINSQPLAVGFGLIFGIDLLYAFFSGYLAGSFDSGAAALIALQSLAIIIFYAGIWYLKPYSTNFFVSLNGMRMSMQEKVQAGWRAALRVILLLAVLGAINGFLIVAAMLLPGMTLSLFLVSVDLALGWNFLPIAVIFLSQVVFIRYLQGSYSRELLMQVGDYKVHVWEELVLRRLAALPKIPEDIPDQTHLDGLMAEVDAMNNHYLRMKIYRPEYHDLFGLFPVYLIVPDLHQIMDWHTVAAPGREARGSDQTCLDSTDQTAG